MYRKDAENMPGWVAQFLDSILPDFRDAIYAVSNDFNFRASPIDEKLEIKDGEIVNFGRAGDIMMQGQPRALYRGENAIYPNSRAGLHRVPSRSERDDLLYIFRLAELQNFLMQLDPIRNWPYPGLNVLAIAQHYGLKTHLLDFTSDYDTATFFACCTYDRSRKAWRPLSESEIRHSGSRRHVDDARYGIIYEVVDVTDENLWQNDKNLTHRGFLF